MVATHRPLPMSRREMRDWYGWDELDVLLISGDAYVDHPAFGIALIARVLLADGFRVGVCAQPQSIDDLTRLGRPRLCCGIGAGNLDSMLNHYTAARKPRGEDHYSPAGRTGLRPDRATIAYTALVKQAFKGLITVIGGVEASLRRFVHYDHWSRTLRRSILADSKADLLVYGMGERAIRDAVARLATGAAAADLRDLPGTCHVITGGDAPPEGLSLPGYAVLADDHPVFARTTATILREQDPVRGHCLIQDQGWCTLVQQPPAFPLTTAELDAVYALPFTRRAHPAYRDPIPALATVRHSIQTHRGCVGACAFCAIGAHQGRIVSSRSPDNILAEAARLAEDPDFHGTIDDLGGPSANMYALTCDRWATTGACRDRQCLWPEPCPNLRSGAEAQLALLRAVRALPAVRHAFVQSGLRHDLILRDGPDYLREILAHHTSGRLKVAPEAADDAVLRAMRKPPWQVFERFLRLYRRLCREAGCDQAVIPYLMAAHPGADLAAAATAALRLVRAGMRPDQVQEFIPTPQTLATAMQVAGIDPADDQPLPIATGDRERRMHKALLLADRADHARLARAALDTIGRTDLTGPLRVRTEPATGHRRRRRGRR